MREIPASRIVETVARLCQEANYVLGPDVVEALKRARDIEESPLAVEALGQIVQNAEVAARDRVAMCQDTGVAVVFVEIGQQVQVAGGNLADAVNEGVRRGYSEGYLRASIVAHPLRRTNTGDNTPAVIHMSMVEGGSLRIVVMPKGAGSENKSALKMLKPSDGVEGVKQFVVETVRNAGPDACPPFVVGVGIGGNLERCALLAKQALLRPIGKPNPDSETAALERELLDLVNATGIGPGGFGGRTTALAVHVETFPCHIASLPVAVNVQCHAERHAEAVL